ncbi:hypothetical protein NL676_005025 [Syzygium grande]|nr:hypothetical protein NL676_005025 [Syzygium grande]
MWKQTYRVCLCFSRRFNLRTEEAPDEIKRLFAQYSENGIMFLIEVQKEERATRQDAQAIVDSLRELKHLNILLRKGLSFEAFFRYLFGDANPPLSPNQGVHHDMDAPLSHYFIYTGHNSYLTGNQLSSDSSDVPIIKALQRGVRVIELDVWPNSSKDDIDVLHGGTLTPPVQLITCLRSIKEHAFVASEYPVIITFEDHLTPDLQAKVAEMVTQTYGEMLFCPESECLKEFPSRSRSRSSKAATDEEDLGKELPQLEGGDSAAGDSSDSDEEDNNHEEILEDSDKAQQDAVLAYVRLIGIHAVKRKGGLKNYLRINPEKVTRLSLNEQKLEKAVIGHGKDIIRFTQRNLLRIFPKATRIDSSNYNPMIGWRYGAQMVALNMQGHGKSLWLMHGMFRANGGCGYVKKPEFLMKSGPDDEVFDPNAELPVKTTLKVNVYMGDGWYYDFHPTHFDAYSPPDFYTRVGIAGVPADTVMKRTRTLEDNWTPVWNEEFEFPLTVPELALLRIEVNDYDFSEKDDFGGQTCLPVWELRRGIRSVPLHNYEGEKYRSVRLLMRFEFV